MVILDLPKLDIRPLYEEDIEQVAELMYSQWRAQYAGRLPDELVQQRTAEFFKNYLNHEARHQTRVAWLGKRCVGMVSIAANCIEELWILVKYRRRGIGSKLLQQALQQIASHGFRQAQIGVEDFNHNAIRFLQAREWKMLASQSIPLTDELVTHALVFAVPVAPGD